MGINPTEPYEATEREVLVVDIMMLLNEALHGGESIGTYELAERIVELTEAQPEQIGLSEAAA